MFVHQTHSDDFDSDYENPEMMNSDAKEASDSESEALSDQFDLDSSDFDVSDNEPSSSADDNHHRIRIHVKGNVDQENDDNNNNKEEFPTKTILTINGDDSLNDSITDNGICQAVNIIVPEITNRIPLTTIVQISGVTQEETNTDPPPPPPPPPPAPLLAESTTADTAGIDPLDDDENAVIVDFLGKANELVGPHI